MNKLIESLNKLGESSLTYSKFCHDELIRKAFENAGELSEIESIEYGIEKVYYDGDNVIVEFPDINMVSNFEGQCAVFEHPLLKVVIDGDNIELCI